MSESKPPREGGKIYNIFSRAPDIPQAFSEAAGIPDPKPASKPNPDSVTYAFAQRRKGNELSKMLSGIDPEWVEDIGKKYAKSLGTPYDSIKNAFLMLIIHLAEQKDLEKTPDKYREIAESITTKFHTPSLIKKFGKNFLESYPTPNSDKIPPILYATALAGEAIERTRAKGVAVEEIIDPQVCALHKDYMVAQTHYEACDNPEAKLLSLATFASLMQNTLLAFKEEAKRKDGIIDEPHMLRAQRFEEAWLPSHFEEVQTQLHQHIDNQLEDMRKLYKSFCTRQQEKPQTRSHLSVVPTILPDTEPT
ncbi:MAG: hypothetical protein KDI13_07450 [Alphaproteobacteria bacterium]|nr:hypothetical protein [Alphaproteobacteria bacterium]